MNCIHRSIWSDKAGTFVAVSENAPSAGKKSATGSSIMGAGTRFAVKALVMYLAMSFAINAYALPVGGVVVAGGASISSSADSTTITQATQNAAINWQTFNIGAAERVRFVQSSSNSVALNRVLGSEGSTILGSLSANGKVFLVNPNGILFGNGSQVNVGGLVASTLNITDSDFMAGRYKFSGSVGTVINQGSINADGGYVALLGAKVSNEGTISAKLGTVALAAGTAITLDVAGDGLLNITVNQGTVDALVHNGGLIMAGGGNVLLTTQAAGSLLQSVVNNTGVIQAQTLENHNGTIRLMGGMQSGTLNVAGTLDASAPNGGNGGFIETSAAHVNIANDANVTTTAPAGLTGTWLIDPVDFNIQALGGDITGFALTGLLVNNNVTISTLITGTNTATTFFAAPGQGDINVNDVIGVGSGALWTAAGATTTLTLNAAGDVNINRAITATNGNLVACCGRDVNVRDAITTTNGSVLLSAGRDVTLFVGSAMTTTNGNIELCAARNIIVNSKITLTDSGSIPSQSLGLPLGLTLISGTGGTGPGAAGGTVFLPGAADPLRPTVTKAGAPATDVLIYYNPASYSTPTDYSTSFILTSATLTQYMLVFPDGGSKVFDGTTATTFTGLKGAPVGVTLLAGFGSTTTFDTPDVGTNKTISFSGYSLTGANSGNFALATACCGPIVGRTTANITATPVVVPPPFVVPPATDTPAGSLPLFSLLPVLPFLPPLVELQPVDTPPNLPASFLPPIETYVMMANPPQLQTLKPQIVAPVEVPLAAPVQPLPGFAPHRVPKQDRN